MTRRMKILIAAGVAAAALVGGAAYAYAQQDQAGQLRAAGVAGEQADGYLGLVAQAPADVRAQVDQINIQRRAVYTRLASQRNATIEEVAASTACELFSSRVAAGQFYRLGDGQWRRRNGDEPVPRPDHCGH